MEKYFNFVAPYKYGFRLGRFTPRTISGKYIIMFDGEEKHIETSNVEFGSVDKKLSFREFQERVKGTIGIESIQGDFIDDDLNILSDFAKWFLDKYIVSKNISDGLGFPIIEEIVKEFLNNRKNVIG